MAQLFRSDMVWVTDEPGQRLKLSTVYAKGTRPRRLAIAAILIAVAIPLLLVSLVILLTV